MNRKLKLEELGRPDVSTYKEAPKISCIGILDNIRSMQNVGAIFRTADAFKMEGLILCGITAQPPHREIAKSALGATESVEWSYTENIADAVTKLKTNGYEILCVEQTEEQRWLEEFEFSSEKKYALVWGNEVSGVSDEAIQLADACLGIQQYGTKHSLNVSVCAGITMWEICKQLTS